MAAARRSGPPSWF